MNVVEIISLCSLAFFYVFVSFKATSNERKRFNESEQTRKQLEVENVLLKALVKAKNEQIAEISRLNRSVYLSEKDFDMMMDMVENPPEPNEALKKLFRKKKK